MEPERGDTLKQESDEHPAPTPTLNGFPARRTAPAAPPKPRTTSRSSEQFMLGALLLTVTAVAALGIMKHNNREPVKSRPELINTVGKPPHPAGFTKADVDRLEEQARDTAYHRAVRRAEKRVIEAQRGLTPSELDDVARDACGEAFLHQAGLSGDTADGKQLKDTIAREPIANLLHSAMIGANEGNDIGIKGLNKLNGSRHMGDQSASGERGARQGRDERNAAFPGGKPSSEVHHVYSNRLLDMKDLHVNHTRRLDTHPMMGSDHTPDAETGSHSPSSAGADHAPSSTGTQTTINHFMH